MVAVEQFYPGDEDDQVWLRQQTDTDASWRAFTEYRDMGVGRSLKAVAARLGYDSDAGTVRKWAAEQGWRYRVNAYERHVDQVRVAARLEQVRQMEERHAAIAMNSLAALAQPLIALTKDRKLPDGTRIPRQAEMERMSTPELLRVVARTSVAMARLTGVERLARGEPTDLVHGTAGASPEGASTRPLPDEERLMQVFGALEEAGFTAPQIMRAVVQDVEVIREEG